MTCLQSVVVGMLLSQSVGWSTWYADNQVDVSRLGEEVDQPTAQLVIARPGVQECYLVALRYVQIWHSDYVILTLHDPVIHIWKASLGLTQKANNCENTTFYANHFLILPLFPDEPELSNFPQFFSAFVPSDNFWDKWHVFFKIRMPFMSPSWQCISTEESITVVITAAVTISMSLATVKQCCDVSCCSGTEATIVQHECNECFVSHCSEWLSVAELSCRLQWRFCHICQHVSYQRAKWTANCFTMLAGVQIISVSQQNDCDFSCICLCWLSSVVSFCVLLVFKLPQSLLKYFILSFYTVLVT